VNLIKGAILGFILGAIVSMLLPHGAVIRIDGVEHRIQWGAK